MFGFQRNTNSFLANPGDSIQYPFSFFTLSDRLMRKKFTWPKNKKKTELSSYVSLCPLDLRKASSSFITNLIFK